MTPRWISLVFACDDIEPIKTFLTSIAIVRTQRSDETAGILSLLDTIDWHLYQNKINLTSFESETCYQLGIQSHQFSLQIDMQKPLYPWLNPDDIVPDYIGRKLKEFSSNRVFISQADCQVSKSEFMIIDSLEMPVCEIWLINLKSISTYCVRIMPRRGFKREFTSAYNSIINFLSGIGITPLEADPFDIILRNSNRSKNDYAQLVSYRVEPNESTCSAIGGALAQFAQMAGINRPWIADHPDPEFLHDFRIALRRTSCMINSFTATLKLIDTTSIESELKTFAKATATTRDLENLGESIRSLEKLLGNYNRFSALSEIVAQELDVQYRELSGLTASSRCENLISSMARLAKRCSLLNLVTTQSDRREMHESKGQIDQGPTVPISVTAKSAISLQYESFIRLVAKAKKHPSDRLHHRLRKEIRQYRYLMEFLNGIDETSTFTKTISKLKELQSELGRVQDANIQIDLLGQLCENYLVERSVQKAVNKFLVDQRKQGLAKYQKQIKHFSKSPSLHDIQLAFTAGRSDPESYFLL